MSIHPVVIYISHFPTNRMTNWPSKGKIGIYNYNIIKINIDFSIKMLIQMISASVCVFAVIRQSAWLIDVFLIEALLSNTEE